MRADDGVTRADHDVRIELRRPQPRAEFPREAIMHTREAGLAGLAEVEIGEQPPAGDRQIPYQRVFDSAEPAHEARQRRPRDPVGQQEVEVLLLGQTGDQASNCHEPVSWTG